MFKSVLGEKEWKNGILEDWNIKWMGGWKNGIKEDWVVGCVEEWGIG
jgi:hypothetical protein